MSWRDRRHLGRRVGRKLDSSLRSFLVAEDLIHCETALCGELLERHARFGMLPEVLA